MLAIGRRKVGEAHLDTTINLVNGDACDLKSLVHDNSVDCVTMAFGIRNVKDRLAALAEIRRVLRPGTGVVGLLELNTPDFFLARWFVQFCVPVIGATLSGGAFREYLHLERSVLAFPTQKEFQNTIHQAGLENIDVSSFMFGAVSMFLARCPVDSTS